MTEEQIKQEFAKCESLFSLGKTALELKERGAGLMLINKCRIARHKEILQSVSNFDKIDKTILNYSSEDTPISNLNLNMSILKSPFLIVSDDMIIF